MQMPIKRPKHHTKLRILPIALLLILVLSACSSGDAEALGEQIGYYDLFSLFAEAPPFIRILYGGIALGLLVIGEKVFYALLAVTFGIFGAQLGLDLGNRLDPGAIEYELDFSQSAVRGISFLMGIGIGGAAGWVLTQFIFGVALFVVGAALGLGITDQLWQQFSTAPVSGIALIIGAIVGGALLVVLSFLLLVLASSLVGAILLAAVLELNAIWMVIFFVAGVGIQYLIAVIRKRQETFLIRWARRHRNR